MSETIHINRPIQADMPVTVKFGQTYTFVVGAKRSMEYIEVPDLVFNLNSAVPCLDENKYLVRALFTAQKFAMEHQDRELVLFGHTDTSGEIEPNYRLSEKRAAAVKALLLDDRQGWETITSESSTVRDYQTILNTLDSCYGWGCSCGEADNIDGPKTKSALKIFQQRANEKYGCGLVVDGKIGPKTWSAILTTCREIIRAQHQNPDEVAAPTLGYAQGQGVYGCGESFPIDEAEKDGHRSQRNRRVELVFFRRGKSDTLAPPPDLNATLTPADCFAYDFSSCDRIAIPLSQAGGESGGADWIEIQLNDEQDRPIPNQRYIVFADEGTKISGQVDEQGYAKVEKLFDGEYYVVFPDADMPADEEESSFVVEEEQGGDEA